MKQKDEKTSKKLNESTLDELWVLFPIFLVPHRSEWHKWFLQEKRLLQKLLGHFNANRIEHIGSTAIPNIYAKNIVDILIEISNNDFDQAISILKNSDYILMYQKERRAAFNKGYTEKGFADKVFHIHLRKQKDNDELYFRDYLIEFPKVAKTYERLKLGLWKKFEHNRDRYTNAKTEFIKGITKQAKALYTGRY